MTIEELHLEKLFAQGWIEQTDSKLPTSVTIKRYLRGCKTNQEAFLRGQSEAERLGLYKKVESHQLPRSKVVLIEKYPSGIPWP